MRIGSIITTFAGLAIAGGSVFIAREQLLQGDGSAVASAAPEYTEIVVANQNIQFCQEIEPHLVRLQRWPSDALPAGAIIDMTQVLPEEGDGSRRAKANMVSGEVVLVSKLSGFGEKVPITQKLGENTRAMAIKVDAVTAVGGFVTPGDFVDIVLTQGRASDIRAVTILQNIRVIGVDQQSEEQVDSPEIARTITVEVTPLDGQKLALAQKAGTLSLTLRTLDGVVDEPLDMVDLRDLLREKSPVEEAAKAPTIKVRRAGAVEVVDIN